MFSKLFAVIMLSCFLLSVAVAAPATLPLNSPVVPFAKKNQEQAQTQARPVIRDHQIKLGSKELQVSPDGPVRLFSNGRLVAMIYFAYNTKRAWFPVSSKIIKDKKSSYDSETKTFNYSGMAPLTKKLDRYAAFDRKISLLADGKVKFDYSWDTPTNDQDIICQGVYVTLMDSDKETQIAVDGKVFKAAKQSIFFKAKPKKLVFNPDLPKQEFVITPESPCYVTGMRRKRGLNPRVAVHASFDPGKSAKRLTFVLDMGQIAAEKESRHKHAGIDFYQLENLELPDYKSSKNLFQNSSFEQGFRYLWQCKLYTGFNYYPQKFDNAFQIDDNVGKFGSNSLKIKTWCKKKNVSYSGYITSAPVPVEPGKYTLSFYAKGDRPGKQWLSVFMPQVCWLKSLTDPLPGCEKFKDEGVIVSDQWQRFSCVVDIAKSMPARVAFGACSATGDGFVWVDGVQLQKGTELTDYQEPSIDGVLVTSDSENFLRPGDAVDAALVIKAKPESKGEAEVEVKNFFGEKLFAQTFSFSCDKAGQARVALPFNGRFDQGIYVVKVTYKLTGGPQTYDFYRFSIMEKLTGNERLRTMFASDYGRYCNTHLFKKILKRNDLLGLGSKTHLSFWYDDVIKEYENNNIKVTDAWMSRRWGARPGKPLGYYIRDGYFFGKELIEDFRNNNPSGELTEAYLKRFREAVTKCAKRNPKIRRWSFMGEASCWFPEMCGVSADKDKFEKFMKLQVAFYEGVKAADPTLEVYNGDPPNMDRTYGIKILERQLAALKGRIKYDYIGIHTYRAGPDNPDLDADTEYLFNMLKRYGYEDTKVFWPEGMHYGPYEIPQWNAYSAAWTPGRCWYYGPLSYDMGWTERRSAAWRARSWLVALKYQDRISSAVSAQVNNFALDYNFTPYATQKIPHTLTRLLGDAVFKEDIRFAPYTRCYLFEDKDRCPVAVVWGNHPKLDNGLLESFTAEVNLPGPQVQLFDLMEQRRNSGQGDKITFPVSSFPLFFKGQPGETEAFSKAFANASLTSGSGIVAPLKVTGLPVKADAVELTVSNQMNKEFKGKIVAEKLDKEIRIKPFSKLVCEAGLAQPLQKNAIVKEKVDVELQNSSNSKTFKSVIEFRGFLCGKAKREITIDGQLKDWQDIPEIPLTNRFVHKNRNIKVTDEDISGWFKAAWDKTGLYLCIKVKDDKLYTKIYPVTGRRWNNDSVQIFFDSLGDATIKQTAGYDENDYDYALFPNADHKSATTFRFASPDAQLTLGTAAPQDRTIADDIPSSFSRTEDGYIYEVKFPAKYLLPAELITGKRIGVGIFVNDRDDESGVKSALTTTPNGTECYKRPQLWPIMLLTE